MNGMGGFFAGSIFAKLILDKSGWNQSISSVGQDEKKVKGMSTRMTASFRKIGAGMTIAGAAIVGSFGKMISTFVDTGDELDKMSKRTGFTTTALSELKHAANITGADLGSLEKGIKKMSKSIVDADAGLTTYQRAFDRLNISTEELIGLSPEEQFLKIGDAIAGLPDPTERTATAMDIFGRAGTQLIPLFSEGAEGLADLRQEAHDLGIVFDQDAATAAAKLKDEQTRLKGAMQGLGMQLAQTFVPILMDLATKITGVVTKIKDWMKEHPGLTSAITKIVGGLGAFMLAIGPIVVVIPKLISGFKVMKIAIMALSGPIGLVVAGLSALTLGFLKVKAAQDKAKQSAKNFELANTTLKEKLKGIAKEAGLTTQEFEDLTKKYKNNSAALGMAISKGEEGVELQEAMRKKAKEHKEEQEKLNVELKETPIIIDNNLIPSLEDAREATDNLKDKTSDYMDILHDLGIITATETETKINDLKGAIGFFDEQLANNEITLYEYNTAVADVKGKIEELSTSYTFTAIPAANNFHDVLSQAPATLETQYFTPMETKTDKMTTGMTTSFSNFSINSDSIIDSFFSNISTKGINFKGVWNGIWGNIKNDFKNILSSMVSSFTGGFINKILGSLSGFGGSFKSGLTSILGGATGPGGLIGTVIGGALGGFLSKLFGGGGLSKAGMNEHLYRIHDRLVEIKDFLYIVLRKNVIQDWTVLFNQHKDLYIGKFTSLQLLLQNTNSILREIRDGAGIGGGESKKKKKHKKKGSKDKPGFLPGNIIVPNIPGADTFALDHPGLGGGTIISPGGGGGGTSIPEVPYVPDVPIPGGGGGGFDNKIVKRIARLNINSINIYIQGVGLTEDPRRFIRDKFMPEFEAVLKARIGLKKIQQALEIG